MVHNLVDGYAPRKVWPYCLEAPGNISREAKGRYANILLDDWFKRAFGSENRKRLLQLLLQELIPERKIAALKYAPQEHVNEYPGKKDIRMDIECTDEDGSCFIVELQVTPQNWIYERALYYSSFAVINQLEKGVDEYKFPTVYFIGLMDFCMHPDQRDRVLYRYSLRDALSGEEMTERIQFIFLELPNCSKALTPEASLLDNFCYAMHNMQFLPGRPLEMRQEIFELLFESADITKFTPEEKVKYEHDMTTERDRRNQLKKATDDALAEGREKGLAEGREKGLAEGREKGLAEGEQEALKKEIARNLIKKEMSDADIAAIVPLSLEEIQALRS